MSRFYIDGTSTARVDQFLIWKVVDEDRELVSGFYGPMSCIAAVTFCAYLNKENVDMDDWTDYLNKNTHPECFAPEPY